MNCTIDMRFVDTNVLLYSISTAGEEADKAAVAVELLKSEDLCLSVQVLQEFYVQATHANRAGALTHEVAIAFVDTWLRFPVQELSIGLMGDAFAARRRWQVSYWDAAIVEAARRAGAAELLTEDLQDEQDFDGVRTVNPFN